ncbi:MAG: cation:proton antiporter [Alphaproteobacteria bacterium]|nr:cation:proton antiporter [Alphaproteobacteria bacterium]
MIEPAEPFGLILLIVGVIIIASLLVRTQFPRLQLPAMVGYILIGMALFVGGSAIGHVTPLLRENLEFLAQLGVVVLLFRVGLESDLDLLVQQLGKAALIWLPNMAIAALFGFAVVYYWPGYGLIPALFMAVAASATSISASAAIWEEAGALKTPEGALLLDAAELDHIAAVILMSLLFALLPLLTGATEDSPWSTGATVVGLQLLKLAVLSAGCYIFSRRFERPLTAWFAKIDNHLGSLLFATGIALLIAALADLLGFSLAIGALFAGLAFSRDPAGREIDRSFSELFVLLSPFLFVAIGLSVDITVLLDALGLSLVLLVATALGKFLGAAIPASLLTSPREGALIGVSMIPRAEIFLIVMLHGVMLGGWAVPKQLYVAAVFVSIATCILSPIIVRRLLTVRTQLEEAR